MDQSEEDLKPFRPPRLIKDRGDKVLRMSNQVCTFTVSSTRESFGSAWSISSHNQEDIHNQSLFYSSDRIMESIPDKIKEDLSINKDSSFVGCGRSL